MKNILSKILISVIIFSVVFLLSCWEDVRELRDSDQWSDLEGNNVGLPVKLPNYLCIID